MSARRAGFTLLEVVIALAILAISLLVLIDAQSTAVLETVDSEKILTGTWLAQEKMSEATLRVEKEGFKDQDIDEEGDFSDFGQTDQSMGEKVDFGDSFDGFKWAYTVRRVDIQLGDIAGSAEQLQGMGFGPQQSEDGSSTSQTPAARDLSSLGFQPDMITQMLQPYIREVRVLVWWSTDEPDLEKGCEQCVELVSHVINPTGAEQHL
jgi:general secretion pathway protein I